MISYQNNGNPLDIRSSECINLHDPLILRMTWCDASSNLKNWLKHSFKYFWTIMKKKPRYSPHDGCIWFNRREKCWMCCNAVTRSTRSWTRAKIVFIMEDFMKPFIDKLHVKNYFKALLHISLLYIRKGPLLLLYINIHVANFSSMKSMINMTNPSPCPMIMQRKQI
jgi:hypothetical protein